MTVNESMMRRNKLVEIVYPTTVETRVYGGNEKGMAEYNIYHVITSHRVTALSVLGVRVVYGVLIYSFYTFNNF